MITSLKKHNILGNSVNSHIVMYKQKTIIKHLKVSRPRTVLSIQWKEKFN